MVIRNIGVFDTGVLHLFTLTWSCSHEHGGAMYLFLVGGLWDKQC